MQTCLLPLYLLLALWPPTASVDAASTDLGVTLARDAGASGFAKGSSGEAPDKVHGEVLCRGDYTGAKCTNGLTAAFLDLDMLCLTRRAVVYYDYVSNEPEWSADNMNWVKGTEAAEMLLERVVKLMNSIADLATSGSPRSTSQLYATGEAGFGEQGVSTVYGMVQCKLDLTGPQCKSCLDGIIGQMRKLFSNDSSQGQPSSFLIGGRLIGVRCNLRYEKELFFEETNDTMKIDMPKSEEYPEMDVMRCIQIALLCVQDVAEDRPTMHDVMTMLGNGNKRLLRPAQPGSCSIHIFTDAEIEARAAVTESKRLGASRQRWEEKRNWAEGKLVMGSFGDGAIRSTGRRSEGAPGAGDSPAGAAGRESRGLGASRQRWEEKRNWAEGKLVMGSFGDGAIRSTGRRSEGAPGAGDSPAAAARDERKT
uniref:Uncharacterized protein n=1 Tax=Aegilops tauschii TaxID=37682 RepID=M8C6V5_AEGTA